MELGYVRMTNLLPNQIYKEVVCPTEIQSNMPVEHKVGIYLTLWAKLNYFCNFFSEFSESSAEKNHQSEASPLKNILKSTSSR